MSTIETQQAKLDAPFVLYDLRHTFATRAIRSKKVDLPQLAAILGHDGIRSVMKYVHLNQEDINNGMLALHQAGR